MEASYGSTRASQNAAHGWLGANGTTGVVELEAAGDPIGGQADPLA